MGMPAAPNFADSLDKKDFQVQDSAGLSSRLQEASAGIDSVHNDNAPVESLLQLLQGQQGGMDARAQGQGLTAGAQTRFGQDDLGASSGSSASLGKALMKLGSRMGAAQGTQVGAAQGQQQDEAMAKAQQLKQAQAQARINIYKQEMALQDAKFQMQRGVTQSQDGLQMANMQLRNMFNQAVSTARNAKDLADIKVRRDEFNQVMSYIGMGLGAASAVTAGAAASYANQGPAATSDDSSGTHLNYQYGGGTTGEPTTYGGITNTGGTGSWGHNAEVTGSSVQSATGAFYNRGGDTKIG